jgi:hypothetical protein
MERKMVTESLGQSPCDMTCPCLVTRYIGNPEEPTKERQPCGRPVKFRMTAEGSKVSVLVCGRHVRPNAAVRTLVPVRVESIEPYVPTPADLDDLMADISASAYASACVEIVEEWTRKHWGVESAMTTKMKAWQ